MEFDAGVRPLGYRVVVKPDKVESKTRGGIELPPEVLARQEVQQIKATLISKGDTAFQDEFMWGTDQVEPGARVWIERYAGYPLKKDGEDLYRIINDKDVIALVTNEELIDV